MNILVKRRAAPVLTNRTKKETRKAKDLNEEKKDISIVLKSASGVNHLMRLGMLGVIIFIINPGLPGPGLPPRPRERGAEKWINRDPSGTPEFHCYKHPRNLVCYYP